MRTIWSFKTSLSSLVIGKAPTKLVFQMASIGLFLNYVIFSAPFQPLVPPLSSLVIFWYTHTCLPIRWRYLWTGKWHVNDRLFLRRTLTAHGYISSVSNFWCFWGEWFDFHSNISMVRVSYSAVSVFFLLPPASSLSSVIFCWTPSPPLSSFVIFWLTPPYPLIGWRNLWTAPYVLEWWCYETPQNVAIPVGAGSEK